MEMTADEIRNDRLMRSPPFLRGGYRPFFLGGSLWAVTVVLLWVLAMAGAVTLPTTFDALAWHRHEMLFGYLGGVIGGFMMTAIPNWTGRPPISGGRLAGLAGLWLAARLAILFSAAVGPAVAFALDVGFFLVLFAVSAREVLAAKNRNMPIVGIVLLFALASGLDHAEAMGFAAIDGLGWRLGFAIILVLISLIGGRIIPAFTRNWLMKQGHTAGLPVQFSGFDKLAILATVIAVLGWAVAPEAAAVGALLLLAGAIQVARLSRWAGLKAVRDPLVFILHVAYVWLPLGLLLLGLSLFSTSGIARTSAMHALSAGAMASMTLAVMTRATLGHTGRALKADGWTVAIYALVTLGAVVRVVSPLVPEHYMHLIELAGLLWGGAFVLFLLTYGPKLIGPRPDGRP